MYGDALIGTASQKKNKSRRGSPGPNQNSTDELVVRADQIELSSSHSSSKGGPPRARTRNIKQREGIDYSKMIYKIDLKDPRKEDSESERAFDL